MEKVDVVIIGAGILGLAIAAELGENNLDVFLVEKNRNFGQETSSRNSEVIHGGIYYPTGTEKARMCVEGRYLLYDICGKNRIPFRKTGKLIVASEKKEIFFLEELLSQGEKNGVEGLRIVSQGEMKKMEPNIRGLLALYSKETGIVDSHQLMLYFEKVAKDKGVMIIYDCEVENIDFLSDGYGISVNNSGEMLKIKTRIVVNSAGLLSDDVAEMVGIDVKTSRYELHYCKGQYFRVRPNKAKNLNRLVYPVPRPKSGGLGLHATLDLSGGLRIGPDDMYLDGRNKDYSVDEKKKRSFYLSIKKIIPFIEEQDLFPDTSGIRPKLQEQGGVFRDFVISHETDKGFPGFVNLIGIESPGLTAAPAIAKKVKTLLEDIV